MFAQLFKTLATFEESGQKAQGSACFGAEKVTLQNSMGHRGLLKSRPYRGRDDLRMRSASYGLRHPASASCLGRHSRLAGRCPNNSSLFPPLAAVVVVAAHHQRKNYFIISRLSRPAGRSKRYFHGRGRNGKRHLQRRFLRKRGAAGQQACPLSLAALASSPKGGALGMAGKFPVELQSLRARSLPLGELSRSD